MSSPKHIRVTVETEAGKERVERASEDLFNVFVDAKPEQGKANKRVLELLRRYLGTSVRVIKIVSGHHTPRKTILIEED
jgi:uncharacterized protein (TIGR00251 family)